MDSPKMPGFKKPAAKKPSHVRPAGFPTRDEVLNFISTADQAAGKREIAKAFGLKGAEKIALKALLKDMADEGLIDIGKARTFHLMGGVPKVTVLRVIEVDGGQVIAVPEKWEAEGHPIPKLRVIEQGKRGALGIGDRILASTLVWSATVWGNLTQATYFHVDQHRSAARANARNHDSSPLTAGKAACD